MKRRDALHYLGGAILATSRSRGARAAKAGTVMITQIAYHGWPDAYRITNGTVELIVVPLVGRIMRYGYVGGPNMLWENPTVAGKPIPLNTWPGGGGTGGDKIWIWPQDDWPSLIGRDWPPPTAADQAPHGIEIIDGGEALRMSSSPVLPLGLRIVREIRLASTGTEVSFRNRFVKYRNGGTPSPISVWAVTQVPVGSGLVWIRDTNRADVPTASRYKQLAGKPFAAVEPRGVQDSLLRIKRDPAESSKIGAEGDLIAKVTADTLFTVRPNAPGEGPFPSDDINGLYQPMERTQLYAQPDNDWDRSHGIPPYFELELTSPRRLLAKTGETLSQNITWSLERLNIKAGEEDEAVFRPLLNPPVLSGTQ